MTKFEFLLTFFSLFQVMAHFIQSSHTSKKTGESSRMLVDDNQYVYHWKRDNKKQGTTVWNCCQKTLRKCKVNVKTNTDVSKILASTSRLVDAKNPF